MYYQRAFQWFHAHADTMWPDGTFKYGVRSPKLLGLYVYSCTHWLRPCNSTPPPAFGLINESVIGQLR